MPLLVLPLVMSGTTYFALLDSGASDSFTSADVVKQAGLKPVPLNKSIRVRVATVVVEHCTRDSYSELSLPL